MVAILFAPRNWGHRQPWHDMYYLSTTSSPSIGTWDQLNGETLAGKSSNRKVKWINRVGNYWIDAFTGRWMSFGHPDETRKLRNYNSKLANEIHIQHSGLIHITWIDRENTPSWKQRTMKLPNFTKTPAIAISCWNLFRPIFQGVLYQISSYNCLINHSEVT